MSYHSEGKSNICSHCGFKIRPTDELCPVCQTPVPQPGSQEISADSDCLCPVCGATSAAVICAQCGFDSSCDYESFPTLQMLEEPTPAISRLRQQWEASQLPPAERALAFLRAQDWDPHVLAALEEILRRASDGTFTKHHRIEIRRNVPVSLGDKQFCAICGTSNDLDQRYCLGCGVKLKAFVVKEPASGSNGDGPNLKLSKFCDACGSAVVSGSIYCTQCGAKIG